MARPRSTFGKLQRDQAKRARTKAKQEDRLARREVRAEGGDQPAQGPSVDQASVLEQFARLHEDMADGRISLEDFETRQEELRALLQVD
ncbi:MAG TPA: hypothetical protein VMU76_01285 [Acidimicrobiales bacterium]|nr:hypothetical protein [Acidimicrobiales bacterium]